MISCGSSHCQWTFQFHFCHSHIAGAPNIPNILKRENVNSPHTDWIRLADEAHTRRATTLGAIVAETEAKQEMSPSVQQSLLQPVSPSHPMGTCTATFPTKCSAWWIMNYFRICCTHSWSAVTCDHCKFFLWYLFFYSVAFGLLVRLCCCNNVISSAGINAPHWSLHQIIWFMIWLM